MMAERGIIADMDSVESDDQLFDDTEMALTGMHMLLNNKFEEAQSLFEKYR